MRLVCPNCDAKYEVPDGAIPQGGRDVQCSACGHAWFQQHPEVEAELEASSAVTGSGTAAKVAAAKQPEDSYDEGYDEPAAAPVVDASAKAEAAASAVSCFADMQAAPPAAPASSAEDAALAAAIGEIVSEAPISPLPPRRQELDEDVRSVLREEAEREAERRRLEAQRAGLRKAEAEGQMQVQPELGVEPAAPSLTPTQRRLAMLQGKDPDAPPVTPVRPTARRDLLPDVEEINSTLQPGDSSLDDDIESLPDLTKSRSSFRTGFLLAIILLMIAVAIYALAPQLAERFPQMADTLERYTVFVDGLRIWLNERMNAATASLSGQKP